MLLSLSKTYSDAWLNVFEAWLLIFGGVVALGVVGEILAEKDPKLTVSKRQLRLLNEQENLRPKPSKTFWKTHKHFFETLVFVGVIFEAFCDGGIWMCTQQLEMYSDNENSSLRLFAAKIGTTNAWLVSSNFNMAITIEGMRSNNLVLRSTVATLESAAQWRTLSTEQKSKLQNFIPKLLSFFKSNELAVVLYPQQEDPEAWLYAMNIESVLNASGIPAEITKDSLLPTPIYVPGLHFAFDPKSISKPVMGLFGGFKASEISADLKIDPEHGIEKIRIVIGAKPPP